MCFVKFQACHRKLFQYEVDPSSLKLSKNRLICCHDQWLTEISAICTCFWIRALLKQFAWWNQLFNLPNMMTNWHYLQYLLRCCSREDFETNDLGLLVHQSSSHPRDLLELKWLMDERSTMVIRCSNPDNYQEVLF